MTMTMTINKAPATPHPVTDFDPEFIAGVKDIFENKIVFNHLLGLKIDTIASDMVTAHIAMRPELIGHYAHQRMHGGVISAGLDAMGGLAVMVAIGAHHVNETPLQHLQRFAKLGTIDLRVDYLRPAIGEIFKLRAHVLRLGSRVASTRMEFLDAQGHILSAGSAAYIVS